MKFEIGEQIYFRNGDEGVETGTFLSLGKYNTVRLKADRPYDMTWEVSLPDVIEKSAYIQELVEEATKKVAILKAKGWSQEKFAQKLKNLFKEKKIYLTSIKGLLYLKL